MKYTAGLLALFLGCQISATTAQVSTTTFPPQSSAFGVDPIIRITTTFRAAVTVSDGQTVPDMTSQETARRQIYTMAAKECAVLSETFRAECRLGSINTFTQSPPMTSMSAAAASMGYINAMANYELRPR